MNFRLNILRNPLDSLFGGGGSTSSATTTNQQVGAEGNSGPVFGAITVKGNSSKQSVSNSVTKGGGKKNKKATAAGNSPSLDTTAFSGSPTTGTASTDAGAGTGNVNISVVSGDSVAEQHNTTIAEGSIQAQNQLASQSIAAQNDLATATLGVANNLAELSFGFASQASAQSAQNSSDVAQAGQNLAAVGIGTQAAQDLISPTGGAAVDEAQSGGGNLTKVLLFASVALGLISLLRRN